MKQIQLLLYSLVCVGLFSDRVLAVREHEYVPNASSQYVPIRRYAAVIPPSEQLTTVSGTLSWNKDHLLTLTTEKGNSIQLLVDKNKSTLSRRLKDLVHDEVEIDGKLVPHGAGKALVVNQVTSVGPEDAGSDEAPDDSNEFLLKAVSLNARKELVSFLKRHDIHIENMDGGDEFEIYIETELSKAEVESLIKNSGLWEKLGGEQKIRRVQIV